MHSPKGRPQSPTAVTPGCFQKLSELLLELGRGSSTMFSQARSLQYLLLNGDALGILNVRPPCRLTSPIQRVILSSLVLLPKPPAGTYPMLLTNLTPMFPFTSWGQYCPPTWEGPCKPLQSSPAPSSQSKGKANTKSTGLHLCCTSDAKPVDPTPSLSYGWTGSALQHPCSSFRTCFFCTGNMLETPLRVQGLNSVLPMQGPGFDLWSGNWIPHATIKARCSQRNIYIFLKKMW